MPLFKNINPNASIQVYLDSSDYSNLSNKEKLKTAPKLKKQYEKLYKWSEDGTITIRYSAITVSEITHTSIQAKDYAIERAKIINKLCKNHTLSDISVLDIQDAVNLTKRKQNNESTLDLSYAFNNDGDWFPSLSMTGKEFLQQIISRFKESFLESNLSRHDRRNLEKKYFKKGKLTKFSIDLIVNGDLKFDNLISSYIPIDTSKNHDILLKSFLNGKISGETLFKKMRLNFLDVVSFVEWFIDNFDNKKRATSWLRDYGESNIAKINKQKDQIKDFKELGYNLEKNDKEILLKLKSSFPIFPKQRSKLLMIEWDKNKKDYIKKGISKDQWIDYIVDSEIGELPSFDTNAQLLEEYMVNNLFNLQRNRPPKLSDAGDIMHARYMPYVDFFRCDKYMKPLILKFSNQYNTQVVSSLSELITGIELELERKVK